MGPDRVASPAPEEQPPDGGGTPGPQAESNEAELRRRAANKRRGMGWPRLLIVIASVMAVLAILATWLNAQVLNTDGWTRTSVRLIENPRVREAVATQVSERVLSVVDVQDLAKEKLPTVLAPLAPALSTAAAEVLPRAIERALTTPAVKEVWERANRQLHARATTFLQGGGSLVSTKGGVVALNLEKVLNSVGQQVGAGNVGEKLPSDKRQLVLTRSHELGTAQTGVKILRHLGWIAPLLAVLFYLGAFALAEGQRRRALLEIGASIVAVALVALLLRRWIESYVVNEVVHAESVRPAVADVLSILTSGWRERAIWLLILGVLVVLAAWLAGPTRWALKARGFVAVPLERYEAWVIGGVVGLAVLIAVLGPGRTPGSGIPLLVGLALVIAGVVALRRQIIEERHGEASADAMGPAPAAPTAEATGAPPAGPAEPGSAGTTGGGD